MYPGAGDRTEELRPLEQASSVGEKRERIYLRKI